jgi:hypothetical protein
MGIILELLEYIHVKYKSLHTVYTRFVILLPSRPPSQGLKSGSHLSSRQLGGTACAAVQVQLTGARQGHPRRALIYH